MTGEGPVLPAHQAELIITPLDREAEQARVEVTGTARFVARMITAAGDAFEEEAER